MPITKALTLTAILLTTTLNQASAESTILHCGTLIAVPGEQ